MAESKDTRIDSKIRLGIVFSSRRRCQLIGLLADSYPDSINPTSIVKQTDFSYQALYDHLAPLETLGLLDSSNEQKRKYYRLTPDLTITEEIVDLHEVACDSSLIESPRTFQPLFQTKSYAKILVGISHYDDMIFTQPEITSYVGISSASFYPVISDFVDQELVEKHEEGKNGDGRKPIQYQITDRAIWDQISTANKAAQEDLSYNHE